MCRDPAAVATRSKAAVKKPVGTQTGAPHKHMGLQASGCKECRSLALAMEGSGDNTYVRCEQVNDLLILVAELKEEVERLRSIRERERERDRWTRSLREREEGEAPHKSEDPLPSRHQAIGGHGREEGEWKQVPARGSGRIPSRPLPPSQLPLQNR